MTNQKTPSEAYELKPGGVYAVTFDGMFTRAEMAELTEKYRQVTRSLGVKLLVLGGGARLVTPPAPAIKWTSDIPTEPGCYWLKAAGVHPQAVEVVSDFETDRGELLVRIFGFNVRYASSLVEARWAGPLEPPAE